MKTLEERRDYISAEYNRAQQQANWWAKQTIALEGQLALVMQMLEEQKTVIEGKVDEPADRGLVHAPADQMQRVSDGVQSNGKPDDSGADVSEL